MAKVIRFDNKNWGWVMKGRVCLATLISFFVIIAKSISPVEAVNSAWDSRPPEVQRAQGIIEGTFQNALPKLVWYYTKSFAFIDAARPRNPSIKSEKELNTLIKLTIRLRAYNQSISDLIDQLKLVIPHPQNAATLTDRVLLAKPEDYTKSVTDPEIVKLERLNIEASKKLFCLLNTMTDPDYDCSKL